GRAAVGASVAVERVGGAAPGGRGRTGPGDVGETQLLQPVGQRAAQIVRVHVRAGRDGPGGHAERMAVFDDRRTRGDVAQREFVAGGNRLADADAGELRAGLDRAQRDRDV